MKKYVTEALGSEFQMKYYNDIGYPRDVCTLHAHPYHEFQLISAGDITYTTSERIQRVRDEKCFIFSRPFQLHNPYVNQKLRHERHQIMFTPSLLSSLIPEYAQVFGPLMSNSGIWRINDTVYEQMRSVFDALFCIYQNCGVAKSAIMEYRLLTASLMNLATEAIKASSGDVPPVPPSYIGGIVKYIQEHFQENITTELLSSLFFVSTSKLNLDFKREVGMTVRTFITLTRIDEAKRLLRQGYTVGAVVEMCGYHGASYFIKVFYEYTQLTPLKYQQLILSKNGLQ